MDDQILEQLKYPVGKYKQPATISEENRKNWIETIAQFPAKLTVLTENLSSTQLGWLYRPGGWTIKQVVHHCADSHINSIVRFKLALTEDLPAIRPYFEEHWAELADGTDNDIGNSLILLTALHKKWVILLNSLTPDQLERQFIHPDGNQKISILENIGVYAWHCDHHLAHVQNAIASGGKHRN